jgi:ACS family tartrate transporter-like MFS transporter
MLLGLQGWEWLYIFWSVPALILGIIVLFCLTDHPEQAKWLTDEEKRSLRAALDDEKTRTRPAKHMSVLESLYHPRVLLLSLAYFCIVTGNYGIDFFLPSILKQWYSLEMNSLTWLVLFPPLAALAAILLMGWSSDRTGERRFHSALPGLVGGAALLCAPYTQGHLWVTIGCFMIAGAGLKAYLPPFWCLPSLFLTEAAAAGSIGLINAIGNLGGQAGPWIVGGMKQVTGSFFGGLYVMGGAMILYSVIILCMKLERPSNPEPPGFEPVMQESLSRQPT